MGLDFGEYLTHWDYYVSLETELIKTSRYVAFTKDNEKTYSTEFSIILQAASAEVDVIMKLLCEIVAPTEVCKNINNYQKNIKSNILELTKHKIFIDRYNIKYQPWLNWNTSSSENPCWWTAYNNVKHKRDKYFNEATLKNTINAMGAFYITLLYYYMKKNDYQNLLKTIRELGLEGSLIRIENEYYYTKLLCKP